MNAAQWTAARVPVLHLPDSRQTTCIFQATNNKYIVRKALQQTNRLLQQRMPPPHKLRFILAHAQAASARQYNATYRHLLLLRQRTCQHRRN